MKIVIVDDDATLVAEIGLADLLEVINDGAMMGDGNYAYYVDSLAWVALELKRAAYVVSLTPH